MEASSCFEHTYQVTKSLPHVRSAVVPTTLSIAWKILSKPLLNTHPCIPIKQENDPKDFATPVKAIALPQHVPSTSDRRLIKLENQVQCLMEAHLALTQPTQVNKITTSCEICSGPHDTKYCMEDPEQAFVEYASSRTDEAGVRSTPSQSIPSNKVIPTIKLGRPFVEISKMTHDPPEGVVRFINGTNEVAYKMPHKIEQYDSLSDLEKEHTKSVYLRNEEDKRKGVDYVMSKILGFYKECLKHGPEYLRGIDDEGEVTFYVAIYTGIKVIFDEKKLERSYDAFIRRFLDDDLT
ncbi:hypothetical protein Tco_1398947, partial [Tanacetum coccineum]